MFSCILIVMVLIPSVTSRLHEPACSKYDFEEKVLEKLVRAEHTVEMLEKKIQAWEYDISAKLDEFASAEMGREKSAKLLHDKYNQNIDEKTRAITQTIAEMENRAKNVTKEVQETLDKTLQENKKSQLEAIKTFEDSYKTPTVVFLAKDESESNVVKGKVIRFGTTTVNIGAAYDISTGYFTTPYAGTYLLSVYVCSVYKKHIQVNIMAADKVVGPVSNYDDDSGTTCASNVVPVVLAIGDKAWVEGSYSNARTFSRDTNIWSTFSGLLIHTGTI